MNCDNLASPTWHQMYDCKTERIKNRTLSLCKRECHHEDVCYKNVSVRNMK